MSSSRNVFSEGMGYLGSSNLAAQRGEIEELSCDGRDEEVARLKSILGEMTMRFERQRDAIQRLRDGLPLDEIRLQK
jgi:hypothetical protein